MFLSLSAVKLVEVVVLLIINSSMKFATANLPTVTKPNTLLPYIHRLNTHYDVILASASPRRKELLTLIGLKDYRIVVSSFAEDLGC